MSTLFTYARHVGTDDVMEYTRYPAGRPEQAKARVTRTVEGPDADGEWSVFVQLETGAQLVFKPYEEVAIDL